MFLGFLNFLHFFFIYFYPACILMGLWVNALCVLTNSDNTSRYVCARCRPTCFLSHQYVNMCQPGVHPVTPVQHVHKLDPGGQFDFWYAYWSKLTMWCYSPHFNIHKIHLFRKQRLSSVQLLHQENVDIKKWTEIHWVSSLDVWVQSNLMIYAGYELVFV